MQPPLVPTAVDLRDYVDFSLETPSGRRVFATDVLALDLVCLEPGQATDARTYDTADALYTVLGGRAWVVTDEGEVALEALQALLVPAGVAHGLRNASPDPLILQVITSPPDEAPPAAPGPADASSAAARATARPSLLDRLREALGGPAS